MKKITLAIFFILVLGIILFFGLHNNSSQKTNSVTNTTTFDAKNSTFTIEDAPVVLVNGLSEVPLAAIPDTQITTRYFGNEATGDLNFDGMDDTAFLVTQDGGGSGLFYYVVVALKTDTGYRTTNSLFLGDRIAPQTTKIDSKIGELQVNYAERKTGEPMTAQPSIGVTKSFKIKDGMLVSASSTELQ